MGKVDWDKVETIVDEVLDLPEEDWIEYIEHQCEASREVKTEVTLLLQSIADSEGWLEDAGSFKRELIDTALGDSPSPSLVGTEVDSYLISEVIARGGMGAVYKGERADGEFEHTVAIKLIRMGMDTPENIRLFNREQNILAGLNHPGIAKLLDGGVMDNSAPYLIMEYVDGTPIDQYCSNNKLSISERLELFKDVCRAVQHAHNNLVIHRDLKPDNILITEQRQIKILDFGISKLLDTEDNTDKGSDKTKTRAHILTPEYAAPEQISGKNITLRSDIYALGVLLYKLLADTHPFDFGDKNIVEIGQIVKEEDPLKPSSRKGASKQIKGDLDSIILKAMRKEETARYNSAGELLEDLQRYEHDLPVMAQKGRTTYRMKKFFKRNKQPVLASFIFFLSIVGLTWYYTHQLTEERNQAQQEAERALAASERAVAVKDFLENMITAGNPWTNPEQPQTARDLIEQGALTVEEELGDQPALAAELLGVIGASYQGMREDSLANHYLSRAMTLMDAGAELDPLVTAKIHAEYAGILLRTGQPKEAKQLAQQTLGDLPQHEEAAEVQSQLFRMLANAQSLLGNPSAAQASAEEAAYLVCNTPGRYVQQCINAKMELRHFYEWAGNFEAGLDAAEFAYLLADSTKTAISQPMRLTVTGNYANALSYSAQTAKAIPLLEENVERTLKSYDDDSYRYARALHDLVSAYIYAGRAHDALPRAERVFEVGGTAQPGNPMNSYWMHQIFHLSLDLYMPDRAETVYARYEDDLPDQMSKHYNDLFDVEHLRIQALRNPGSALVRERIDSLLKKFREHGSSHQPYAALLAAEQAVEAGNAAEAGQFLDEFNATLGTIPRSDIKPARARLLNARRLALLDKLDEAMDEARQSMAMLEEIGHRDSPFVAETQAVLAELYCRMDETEEGRALLNESRHYWREIAEVSNGLSAMERLAPACHKADGR